MERLVKLIICFMLISSVGFAQEIVKKNVVPKADYVADGKTFRQVNAVCEEENTLIPNVKNCTFIRSRIINCKLDDSNTFIKSIYRPEPIVEEYQPTEEDYIDYIKQLRQFIRDNGLEVPVSEVQQ